MKLGGKPQGGNTGKDVEMGAAATRTGNCTSSIAFIPKISQRMPHFWR